MTVSIHATSGWALLISPHQSTALPTQPRRQRGRAEESDSFPSPLCHSLPAHLCLSLSVKLFFCRTLFSLTVPLHNLWLWASPCVLHSHRRGTSEPHLLLCLSLSPSLSSVCVQTRPRRWSADTRCPEWSLGCQFPHKSRQSTLSYLLAPYPNFPSNLSLVFLFASSIDSIFLI